MFNSIKNWILNFFGVKKSMDLSKKKFIINNEERVDRTTVVSSVWSSTDKMKINALTRPKQCPVCRTEGKVTANNSSRHKWRCKECDNTWG